MSKKASDETVLVEEVPRVWTLPETGTPQLVRDAFDGKPDGGQEDGKQG